MKLNLEIVANIVTTVSVFLAGRNSIHTWWTGILSCILFAIVFAQSQLYADVVLQLFFIATSMMGWWHWQRGNHGAASNISRTPPAMLTWVIPLGIVASVGYGILLHSFTNAYAPFIDSAVLVFSVIGQLLMMKRRIESWLFWVSVNTIAVPLYASRGLYLTAVLYASYWIYAIISWRHWRRIVATVSSEAPTRAQNQ